MSGSPTGKSMTFATVEGGDGVPLQPDWTSVYSDELDILAANEEWGIVVRELQEAGTLAAANGHAIRRLVEFRIQYERSSRHVAENGPVLKGKRAKVGQWNPHWSVMCQADGAIRALEAELGLAPTRRSKATKVQRAKKTVRAADRYLKPVS